MGVRAGQCRYSVWEHVVGAKRMESGWAACNWCHEIMTPLKSTGTRTRSHPDVRVHISPHPLPFGSFGGFSLHSAPPSCLVTSWDWGAYSFVPYPQVQPLPVRAHFLKCKFLKLPWLSKSTIWKSLTHKEKREATSEWKNSIFVSVSLQEL